MQENNRDKIVRILKESSVEKDIKQNDDFKIEITISSGKKKFKMVASTSD